MVTNSRSSNDLSARSVEPTLGSEPQTYGLRILEEAAGTCTKGVAEGDSCAGGCRKTQQDPGAAQVWAQAHGSANRRHLGDGCSRIAPTERGWGRSLANDSVVHCYRNRIG